MPSPTCYDELYYEIIRVHQIFDNLYSMGEYAIASVYFTVINSDSSSSRGERINGREEAGANFHGGGGGPKS